MPIIIDTKPIWREFEDVVRRILEANRFSVELNENAAGLGGFDFIARRGKQIWAIDVKYYRTARAQPSLLDAAAARLVNRANDAKAWMAMLIVSCELSEPLRTALEDRYSVIFVDRQELSAWASKVPELAGELDALLELGAEVSSRPDAPQSDPTVRGRRLSGRSSEDVKGTDLCKKLNRLARGKATWAAYEKLCAEILKYLFPSDLHGWHPQRRTDDGLNRFDFVCRVRPTTEFWKFLIDHLDSRYVLFEFKNYVGRIKQPQILTTEKYLLERGLRRAAIVFSREGADPSAIAMAQGAMREQGKLMLVLDDKIVCEMLHMKERGDDPTDRLFQLADDFLLSLPR